MGNIYFRLNSKIILALTGFPGHSLEKVEQATNGKSCEKLLQQQRIMNKLCINLQALSRNNDRKSSVKINNNNNNIHYKMYLIFEVVVKTKDTH